MAASHGDAHLLPAHLVDTHAATSIDSIDRPIGDGTDTLGTRVACDVEGPDSVVISDDRDAAVRELLDDLDGDTRWALTRRFGIDGEEPASYVEIGHALGISAEAARRRIGRALDRLRRDTPRDLLAA